MPKAENIHLFYSPEWDAILNSLLEYLPFNSKFNLYSISQKASIKYKKLEIQGAANVEQTYIDISNHLIYNDFAKCHDHSNISLTDKGRQLIIHATFRKFSVVERLRIKAEIRELWYKRNWFWIDFIKIIVASLFGALLTLGIQYLGTFKEAKVNKQDVPKNLPLKKV